MYHIYTNKWTPTQPHSHRISSYPNTQVNWISIFIQFTSNDTINISWEKFSQKISSFFRCCWIQPIHFCFVFFAISRLTSYFLFVIHLYIGNFVYLWMDKTISLSLSWAWHNHHHNHSIYFTFLCNQFIILFHSINKHRHLSNTF